MNKSLIDALRREPLTKKELLYVLTQTSSKSHDTLRKTIERQLPKLIALGLVKESGNKYCWYIYPNFFDENYGVKLNHSQLLVPALRRIAGESGYYDDETETTIAYAMINEKSAKTHLTAYPEIFRVYQDYQELKNKTEQDKEQLLTKLDKRVKTVFGEKTIEKNPSLYSENYVSNNIPFVIYQLISSKKDANVHNFRGEIRGAGTSLAVGRHFLDKMKHFLNSETRNEYNISSISKIKKTQQKAFILQEEFRKKTLNLIMKVNSGEPLKAKCRTCPEVYDFPKK